MSLPPPIPLPGLPPVDVVLFPHQANTDDFIWENFEFIQNNWLYYGFPLIVYQLIAGTGITLDPSDGYGTVTISSTGGSGPTENWAAVIFDATAGTLLTHFPHVQFFQFFLSNDSQEPDPWADSSSIPPIVWAADAVVLSLNAGELGNLSSTMTTNCAMQVIATVFNADLSEVIEINATLTVAIGTAGGFIDWSTAAVTAVAGSDLSYSILDGAGLVTTAAGGTYASMISVAVSPA